MMPGKRTLAGVLGAVAAAAALMMTGEQEGLRLTPYQDTGGRWTVCYGQTGIPMHVYTESQCDDMLEATLASMAAQIAANTPGFTTLDDGVKVATVNFAYNVGVATYTKSTLRQMLVRRELPAACKQFIRYKYVAGKDCSVRANNCYGVWLRRQAEEGACLNGIH